MEQIENFFIDKLKEKHIVNNIFKFYYDDWEQVKIKKLRRDIYELSSHFFITNPRLLKQKEKELFKIKYLMMKKYDSIYKEL